MSATERGPVVREVTSWLARNAMPLSGLVPGGDGSDLRALAGVLEGVRVVGLGEATHGTREFFQLKHRLLEYLVTELGFTVLAMEASASAAPAVDAYVRDGVGDPAKAITDLGFWTWRTEEVLAVVEWMRAYNRGRPSARRVRFAGVDPQRCGHSLARLEPVLRELMPDRSAGLLAPLRVLATAYPGALPDPRRRLVRDAEAVLDLLRGHASETNDALRDARILVRAADLVTRPRRDTCPERTAFAARDRCMADAVAELLTDPSARVAVWAHNGHVTTQRHDGAVPVLGRHLRDRYGDAYYALGLLFGSGAFRARRLRPGPWRRARFGAVAAHRIGPAPADCVEAWLAAAHPGDHLLDLRRAVTAPPAVRQWLGEPRPARSFGALAPRLTYRFHRSPVTLSQAYDGLAYIGVSSCSRPLPGP
ncbi:MULTISPECIES: erythromycin esterase family protein [Streptomyces]|uniref:Erythromycin esterase n=1 Tax=Streptomyces fradiae ATCC 10745 = DSM 40063 TaxID=1319510 RepID=A0A1Y2NNU6_STRFR|nr:MULTISPECIES: erythromycin esterase family protein [Streptomyces]KAF0649599.1 hypothetical protein K701_12160 [Streptomyces fradiae ATCC 10745 = DSM 40063]OSY49173.1 Erythromycin esterase [Streptomyces fradiae ATCC 10745 = DSM 40063]